METFWFFRFRFRRAYESAYDSDFRFSLGHKLSYDTVSDSVASENQPQALPSYTAFPNNLPNARTLRNNKMSRISTSKNFEVLRKRTERLPGNIESSSFFHGPSFLYA